MQLLKRVSFLSILLMVACVSNVHEAPENKGAQIIKSSLEPYSISDSLIVNSVVATTYNLDSSNEYHYVVSLFQGEDTWNDTITFMANKNDTARHQVIFARSIYKEQQPASFSAKLIKIKR